MPDSLPRRGFLAACASGLAAGCLGSSPDYDATDSGGWPMARYDAGGTSYVPDASGPRTNPSERWSRETRGFFDVPAFAVGEDTLYLGTGSRFHAHDTASGDTRWSLHEGEPWYDSALVPAPAYGDVMPVVSTSDGVAAIAPSGGVDVFGFRRAFETRWERTTVDTDALLAELGFSSRSPPPVVVDETLYTVASGDTDAVVAIDAETGDTEWTTAVDALFEGRPAVADGRVFVPTFGDGLHAFDADSGSLLWRAPLRRSGTYAPTATDDVVYCHDREFVYAVDADSGDRLWAVNGEQVGLIDTRTPLTVTDDFVYASGDVADGHAVFAFDADTGDLQWHRAGGTDEVPPVAAEDTLYVPEDAGLTAIDAMSGDELWTHGDDRVGCLAVVDDTAYAMTTLGRLYALEGSA